MIEQEHDLRKNQINQFFEMLQQKSKQQIKEVEEVEKIKHAIRPDEELTSKSLEDNHDSFELTPFKEFAEANPQPQVLRAATDQKEEKELKEENREDELEENLVNLMLGDPQPMINMQEAPPKDVKEAPS